MKYKITTLCTIEECNCYLLVFYRDNTPHNNTIDARRQELNDYMQYHMQNMNGETFEDRLEGNDTYYTPKNKQSKVTDYCYKLAN